MNDVVMLLNQSFYDLSFISLGASLVWGILSVFLSPCHVASIPLIIGYINDRKQPDSKDGFRLSLLFGLGILAMLIIMGLVTGYLGRILGDVGAPVLSIAYLFLLLCGIWLLDLPFFMNGGFMMSDKISGNEKLGAFSLGFLYGIVLGPCSFAFIAPMIGIVFTKSINQMWFGIALFFFYAIGHTASIVAAGTFGNKIVSLINSERLGDVSLWIKRFCGVFLIMYSVLKLWETFFN